ncbi:methyl-accepting chemotaxis protein [Ciceribacter sp. sgz301302]|uniref:methyl-accepting chemotaxis protein n=1 Tax=Ciceribacter sp. sgz301302 TaxID=3342379 RepID=UPI0035BA2781
MTGGLALGIGLQQMALRELKVGGPVFSRIVDGKDLIADIMPPPLFLVESYSLASEAAIHDELLQANTARILALKKSYEERRAFWDASALPDDLKTFLDNDVVAKADTFWANIEHRYLTAAAAGDSKALHDALDSLKDDFHAHEAAVVDLVQRSNAHLARTQAEAEGRDRWLESWAMAGSAVSVLLFLAGLWFLRRRAILPLGRISDYMRLLSKGDYSQDVPMTARADEIGSMAQSVDVFRLAAMERQRLREEMEEGRRTSEAERVGRERLNAQAAADLQEVVETLGAGLKRLSECNIRMTIDTPFAAQFEQLRHDFNQSIATFQSTLENVLAKTALVAGNSREMRAAADSLSKRTEQQAAALEQTAAALEEVTATVRASVDHTGETRALVKEARTCATTSSDVVRDAIDAMTRIETGSREIASIIGVIDGIAFQTNLLALNAGVEAARAGDAGKGFAVVAQEVRELAQRSARAASEISSLIDKASTEVGTGVRLVGETGSALRRIEDFVSQIDTKIDAIAMASREQSTGLSEISTAVNAIDQMTQQNAAMVEETSAVSQSLADNSDDLNELVGRFKLNRRARIREPNGSEAQRRAA